LTEPPWGEVGAYGGGILRGAESPPGLFVLALIVLVLAYGAPVLAQSEPHQVG
jgi:hypothetical protein